MCGHICHPIRPGTAKLQLKHDGAQYTHAQVVAVRARFRAMRCTHVLNGLREARDSSSPLLSLIAATATKHAA